MNSERLVIPVLFGPHDIDFSVNTGFGRHGSSGARRRDLDEVGRIDLIAAVAGGGGDSYRVVGRVWKRGVAQDRGLRNRGNQGKEGAE